MEIDRTDGFQTTTVNKLVNIKFGRHPPNPSHLTRSNILSIGLNQLIRINKTRTKLDNHSQISTSKIDLTVFKVRIEDSESLNN